MFMIVALGPNDMEVPCMFYETKEQAVKVLKFTGCTKSTEEDDTWDVPEELDEDNQDGFFDHFFTSYYGGCGEVGRFAIRPVVVEQPTIRWDLD